MTAAAIATLAAQVDPRETDFDPWPWDDGANPDLCTGPARWAC
jgi:hypothetical protein